MTRASCSATASSRPTDTRRNAERTGQFTVSFPRPDQALLSSLASGGRSEDGHKPRLATLATRPAERVDGVLVDGCYLWLECELDQVVGGFGPNSLIVGRIIGAAVDARALRDADADDGDLLAGDPLLAYVCPRRFSRIGETLSLPFPADFGR